MRVLIDADGCPVVDLAVTICRQTATECLILCDTAHCIEYEGIKTFVFDQGADSVDFALVNLVQENDIVITQDYGLASMCLAKEARVLHQDGWEYTAYNIEALLFQRHASHEYRAAGGRTKGPAKRKQSQNDAFAATLRGILG